MRPSSHRSGGIWVQFKVRLQLAVAVEDGVGGEERGLFGDEGTLLHQIGQPSPDLHDFVAAQIGQVARCEHHPRMDTAEHIAERLLYLVVVEHSAMFGTESGDGGEVHARKGTTCFSLVWVLQRPPARPLQNAIIDIQQVEKQQKRSHEGTFFISALQR